MVHSSNKELVQGVEAIENLLTGNLQRLFLLVQGTIGIGKTLLVRNIFYKLSEKRYNCFYTVYIS
jgi:KaiC/GvpD/RAD55 family RecA-like ATPase